jgi:FAD/FMN-containing dehydrogenase
MTAEGRERCYVLNPIESKCLPECVLAFLRQCTGRERAVTAPMIAQMISFHDPEGRKVRAAIAQLIEQGHPIAAYATGFYFISSPEEARAYLKDLRRRAVAIFKRYRAFSLAAQKRYQIPYEQLALDL